MWIRVETNTTENDKVIAFAEGCGISAETATGFLVRFWGRVAEHRADGDLTGMTDAALEKWAGWNGMPTVMATQLRKFFITNGILTGWAERQGKLAARASAERARKRRGSSVEIPPLRNDTVRSTAAADAAAEAAAALSLPGDGTATLTRLLRGSQNPTALLAEVRMILAGGRGLSPAPTPEDVSLALQDLALAGGAVTGAKLRGFVQAAARNRLAPKSAGASATPFRDAMLGGT